MFESRGRSEDVTCWNLRNRIALLPGQLRTETHEDYTLIPSGSCDIWEICKYLEPKCSARDNEKKMRSFRTTAKSQLYHIISPSILFFVSCSRPTAASCCVFWDVDFFYLFLVAAGALPNRPLGHVAMAHVELSGGPCGEVAEEPARQRP